MAAELASPPRARRRTRAAGARDSEESVGLARVAPMADLGLAGDAGASHVEVNEHTDQGAAASQPAADRSAHSSGVVTWDSQDTSNGDRRGPDLWQQRGDPWQGWHHSGGTPGLSAGMSLGAMGHHGTGHGRVVQDGIVMIGGQVVGVTMMTMTMLGRIQIG